MNSNGLTVGDGFKFGCGFLLAAFIAWLVMAIIGAILATIFGGVLGALFSQFSEMSGLLPHLFGLI